jgi:hypothetical protein
MKKLLAVLAALAMSIIPVVAFAQFNPGNEAAVSSGVGGDTMLEIQLVAPGKAVFHVASINAVYLNSVPDSVKAHYTAPDASGNGQAYVVDAASNPALASQQLCWRGVGSDWGKMACAPIVNGTADVSISVGKARNKTFALVPIIADQDKRQLAWAAHPENSRVQLKCSGMTSLDTASAFTVDADGIIRKATRNEVSAYEAEQYSKFCQR